MASDSHERGEQVGPDEMELKDSGGNSAETEQTSPAVGEPEEGLKPTGSILHQIWQRIQEERSRPRRSESNARARNNMDRSKALLVLGTTVVLSAFAFLALFSTSGAERRAHDRRAKPNLGKPETAVRVVQAGSTIPLLNADQSEGDPAGEQLSPDDILATSCRLQSASSQGQEQTSARSASEYALSNAPTVDDPALDIYRRQHNLAYMAPPHLQFRGQLRSQALRWRPMIPRRSRNRRSYSFATWRQVQRRRAATSA